MKSDFSTPGRRAALLSGACIALGLALITVMQACDPTPRLIIQGPLHRSFVTGDVVAVYGKVADLPSEGSAQVHVNGQNVPISSGLTWSHVVPLDLVAVQNRIVVEFFVDNVLRVHRVINVVAVDGINNDLVVDGDTSPDSVGLRISNMGIDQIEPMIEDAARGALDIADFVTEQNPLLDDDCVLYNNNSVCTHRATANAVHVGSNGFALEAASNGPGAIDTIITIDGLFAEVDLFVHETAGTNAFTCGLEIAANTATITASLDFEPNAADPKYVDVTQTGQPGFAITGYNHRFVSGVCDDPLIGGIISFFVSATIEQLVREAFVTNLADPDGAGPLDSPVAAGVESALTGVAIAGPIGNAIGATLAAPFTAIDEDSGGVSMVADSGLTQPNPAEDAPNLSGSYALVDEAFPTMAPLTPGALPYGVGFSISPTALNQMLKAFVEGGMLRENLSQIDLEGVGNVPLDVGLLATLIPEFSEFGAPDTPVIVHISPELAPVFTGNPGPNGEMFELKFGGLRIGFEVASTPHSRFVARFDVAFTAGVDFLYTEEGLIFAIGSLDEAELDGYLIDQALGVDEAVLLATMQGFLPYFAGPLTSALEAFPIPSLLGLAFDPVEVTRIDGWVGVYANLNEVPTTEIQNVNITDLSNFDYREDGFFDVREWRHRVSGSSTTRSVDAVLRGFAGADACCFTGDKGAPANPSYRIEFDVISVPGEEWQIDLEQSILGQFDVTDDSVGAQDAGGFTAFGNGGVISASYTTSTGDSGSFDFIPVPSRVDHLIGASFFSSHEPFTGSNQATLVGVGDTRVTVDVSFNVHAFSDSNFLFPSAHGDKVAIRFGKSDTMDFHYTIGAYPGFGNRNIADDGHRLSVRLSSTKLTVCGNGVLEEAEECDDGNNVDGDGCAADCSAEIVVPFCGDGSGDPGEECDDGNNEDGDGCSSSCTIETGPYCGDGALDAGEECDDGNNSNGDGCSLDCRVEIPGAVCGDGLIEAPETCEPPDTALCDASCMDRAPVCGDGFITAPPETCEPPNTAACNGACTARVASCGDGFLTSPEFCDDGTNDGGEGQCLACTHLQACGDAVVEGTELCELGETVDCSSLGGGFTGGTATCTSGCTAWDTSTCGTAQPGTCTVLYDLSATFQITNTLFGAGDAAFPNLDGLLVLEYTEDGSGNITDGPVNVLHYWVYNDFVVASAVTVGTKVHGFTPACNGETNPSWRLATDPGFPTVCGYTGNTNPVTIGTLSQTTGQIIWDPCYTSAGYWSATVGGAGSYGLLPNSVGGGCLNYFKSVGNVTCAGAFCSGGGLVVGNNRQNATWGQPMINGTAASGTNALNVSSDPQLMTLATPIGAPGGVQSFNVPNGTDSRTWMSWTATRNSASPTTTCN